MDPGPVLGDRGRHADPGPGNRRGPLGGGFSGSGRDTADHPVPTCPGSGRAPRPAPSPLAVVGPQASPAKPAVPEKKPERPVDAGPKSPQGKPAAARTGPPVVEGRILDLEGRPVAARPSAWRSSRRPRRASSMRSSTRSSGWARRPDDLPYAYRVPRGRGSFRRNEGAVAFWRASAW